MSWLIKGEKKKHITLYLLEIFSLRKQCLFFFSILFSSWCYLQCCKQAIAASLEYNCSLVHITMQHWNTAKNSLPEIYFSFLCNRKDHLRNLKLQNTVAPKSWLPSDYFACSELPLKSILIWGSQDCLRLSKSQGLWVRDVLNKGYYLSFQTPPNWKQW